MESPQFPADEFVRFIRARFPTARIERRSNDLGTVWIEVRSEKGHAEAVATADGIIGATDIARELDTWRDTGGLSTEPFAKCVKSVNEAKDFMLAALRRDGR